MAKIKIPGRRSKRWKGYRVARDARTIFSKIKVWRTPQVGTKENFAACVFIGKGRSSRRSGAQPIAGHLDWHFCASGKNPRRALGRALAKAARSTGKRSGAFAAARI